ncbi:MAG: glycerophosphodiester phosphodiesterase family protein [Verrucomicrobia bacterium]|nr:glycerophosphodiester phosphodiesterase family protein [Verrucomicrobiota bacterium]
MKIYFAQTRTAPSLRRLEGDFLPNNPSCTRGRHIFDRGKRLGLLAFLCVLSLAPQSPGAIDRVAVYNQVDPSYVMVAAHRCGYMSNGAKTHPENSLSAALNTISLGADILETDVMMTLDGIPVLMHDSTVNRTTTGSGSVSDMTLSEIKVLYLLGPDGTPSTERVPTLEELMTEAKDKIFVNLDKVDINNTALRDACMVVLLATDTVDQAIFKGGASAAQVDAMRMAYPGETIHYMPILFNASEETTVDTLDSHTPASIELVFNSSSTPMLSAASVAKAAETDTHIFINSLWGSICADHHDAIALAGDPDGSWGWLVDKGATIIQTDNASTDAFLPLFARPTGKHARRN